MAEGDPKIGTNDSWSGKPINLSTPDNEIPTLYHAGESNCSQLVRLVFEEEGIEWNSRLTDIKVQLEQFEKWFLNINPDAAVPVMMYKGKPYLESRDIAQFAIRNISTQHKLLISDDVIIDDQIKALVDRYSNEVMIEQLSMCGWSLQNRFLAIMIPRFLNQSNAKMEEMKKNHPDISDLLDKRIGLVNQRLKLLENPQENRDEALELMQGLLDQLETNLSETEFICGPKYTFADCLFTILLARLKMLEVIDQNLEKRPKLAQWWEKVQKRPSYKKAGVVDTPHRISKVLANIMGRSCSIL